MVGAWLVLVAAGLGEEDGIWVLARWRRWKEEEENGVGCSKWKKKRGMNGGVIVWGCDGGGGGHGSR